MLDVEAALALAWADLGVVPWDCAASIAGAARPDAMQTEHEAGRTTSPMQRGTTSRASILAGDMVVRLGMVLRGMDLKFDRMRQNPDLARALGRQHARDVVDAAARAAFTEDTGFATLQAADPHVIAHLDPTAIVALLDPIRYTGLRVDLAFACAAANLV